MIFEFKYGGTVDIAEWGRLNRKLEEDILELTGGKVSEQDLKKYLKDMIAALRSVKNVHRSKMLFLMYDEPSSMPADARVDFVYRPTYFAAVIMMTAMCRYRSVCIEVQLDDVISFVLNAAMGRDFLGAGYDGYIGFMDTLQIFAQGDTLQFVEKYPHINPKFVTKLKKAIDFLRDEICSGNIKNAWSGKDYGERGKKVLEMLEKKDFGYENEYVWYACYGSNLNEELFLTRYINRCTDKTPPIESRPYLIPHNIYFAKNASTWDDCGKAFLDDTTAGKAYGRIYKITRQQYEEVKRCEGSDYRRRVDLGTIEGIPVYSFTDEQRNECIKMPSVRYFNAILSGLKECYDGIEDDNTLTKYLIYAIMPENAYLVAKSIRQNAHYLTNREIAERSCLSLSDTVCAVKWLIEHEIIRQDGRSNRSGHRIENLEAYFYTVDKLNARELVSAMIHAMDSIPKEEPMDDGENSLMGQREGGRHFVFASRIERSSHNRVAAIQIHGYKCQACGFDFEQVYGAHGRNYIEVHHLNPLSEQGEEMVNPATDLVCLCANCHRMVHRDRRRLLSVEELRAILKGNMNT